MVCVHPRQAEGSPFSCVSSRFPALLNASATALVNVAKSWRRSPRRARITKSAGGAEGPAERSAARSLRRIRFLSVAVPTALVIVRPKRACPTSLFAACKAKVSVERRNPLATRRKSARRFKIRVGASTGPCDTSGFASTSPKLLALRPTTVCGRARDAPRSPCGRRPSPCGRDSHGGACARVCSVDKCVSRQKLRIWSPQSATKAAPEEAPGVMPIDGCNFDRRFKLEPAVKSICKRAKPFPASWRLRGCRRPCLCPTKLRPVRKS